MYSTDLRWGLLQLCQSLVNGLYYNYTVFTSPGLQRYKICKIIWRRMSRSKIFSLLNVDEKVARSKISEYCKSAKLLHSYEAFVFLN